MEKLLNQINIFPCIVMILNCPAYMFHLFLSNNRMISGTFQNLSLSYYSILNMTTRPIAC